MPRSDTPCSIADCTEPVVARGYCRAHYCRWYKYDDPGGRNGDLRIRKRSLTFEERFWLKVNFDGPIQAHVSHLGPCAEWTGASDHSGKGIVALPDGRREGAPRVAWELTIGPIPDGLQACHKCDYPPCVRVDHLFLGTQLDNMQDMSAKGRGVRQNPTHCIHGHAYTDDNTIRSGKRATIRCRTCDQERVERRREAGEWTRTGKRRLTAADVIAIRAEFANGSATVNDLAERFSRRSITIRKIIAGELYRSFGGTFTSIANPRAPRLTAEQAVTIRETFASQGCTQVALARAYGVHPAAIRDVLIGRNYSYAGGPLYQPPPKGKQC